MVGRARADPYGLDDQLRLAPVAAVARGLAHAGTGRPLLRPVFASHLPCSVSATYPPPSPQIGRHRGQGLSVEIQCQHGDTERSDGEARPDVLRQCDQAPDDSTGPK